jgi:high-affinity nickel-transport protein
MNFAYGWAFFNPVRKIYYNLAITGLSIAICFIVGAIEVLGLLPSELHWHGEFWRVMEHFNINVAGYIIVIMFVITWAGAMLIWRFGHVEEKWGSKLKAAAEGSSSLGTTEYWVSDMALPVEAPID